MAESEEPRVPLVLQDVFLSSSRGEEVHEPPPGGIAMKEFDGKSRRNRGWRGWRWSMLMRTPKETTSGKEAKARSEPFVMEYSSSAFFPLTHDGRHETLTTRLDGSAPPVSVKRRQRSSLSLPSKRWLLFGSSKDTNGIKDGKRATQHGEPETVMDVFLTDQSAFFSSNVQDRCENPAVAKVNATTASRHAGGMVRYHSDSEIPCYESPTKSTMSTTTVSATRGGLSMEEILLNVPSARDILFPRQDQSIRTTTKKRWAPTTTKDVSPSSISRLPAENCSPDSIDPAKHRVIQSGPVETATTLVKSTTTTKDSVNRSIGSQHRSRGILREEMNTKRPSLVPIKRVSKPMPFVVCTRPLEDLSIQSPQDYLDCLLSSRGYSTERFSTLQSFYNRKRTKAQKASYHVRLMDLVRTRQRRMLERMLQAGIAPNPCNEFGESLIHFICRGGDAELLRLFLSYGASVQVCDDWGCTPLHDLCRASLIGPVNEDSGGIAASSSGGITSCAVCDTVELLLKIDIRLLHGFDMRGAVPLSYVHPNHWSYWIKFLQRVEDKFWPVRSGPSTTNPDSADRPSNSKHCIPTNDTVLTSMLVDNIPIQLSPVLAQMVASGRMSPEEAQHQMEPFHGSCIETVTSVSPRNSGNSSVMTHPEPASDDSMNGGSGGDSSKSLDDDSLESFESVLEGHAFPDGEVAAEPVEEQHVLFDCHFVCTRKEQEQHHYIMASDSLTIIGGTAIPSVVDDHSYSGIRSC